jgi:hypothetical protein
MLGAGFITQKSRVYYECFQDFSLTGVGWSERMARLVVLWSLSHLMFSAPSVFAQGEPGLGMYSKNVRFLDGGLILACTLEYKPVNFDKAAFAINRRWEAELWFDAGLNQAICPMTVDKFAWDSHAEASSFLFVLLRRQPCGWMFPDERPLPVLLPDITLNMYLPREGHPEDTSTTLLLYREGRVGDGPPECDVHTRHLELLQTLKAGVYSLRDGRPHFEESLE